MIFKIECNYCGFRWEKNVYMEASLRSENCPKCRDQNIRVVESESDKIDYYQGCPPFPPKPSNSKENDELEMLYY